MTNYDEDLEINPFFVAFKNQEKLLFESSLKKDWIIIVPKFGSYIKKKYVDFDFLNHILVPLLDETSSTNEACYKTLGNKKISIRGRTIVIYSKEADHSKHIQILFDETFYTENDQAYQVLCVNEPLQFHNFDVEQKTSNEMIFTLNSVEDSKIFLWKFLAKQNTKHKVDDLINISKSELQKIEPPFLERCISIIKNLFLSSFQIITSRKSYMKLAAKTESLENSLKVALSMYLSHCMHNVLFTVLTDITAERDEEVNKATRIFQYIRASKSGIRFDMCDNIPKARKELSSIRRITTPVEICECIRKVISELSSFRRQSIIVSLLSSNNVMDNNDKREHSIDKRQSLRPALMVTSDDLLSALIFLVIKSDIPNWYTYLEYATNFRFASCSRDDEYQYYLTTLEATLEHIRNMTLNTVEEDRVMDVSSTLSMTSPESSISNGTDIMQSSISSSRIGVVAYELNQIRQLFKLIESGQTSAVKDLLLRSNKIDGHQSSAGRITIGPTNFNENKLMDHYCHPLCNCNAVMSERKSCQSLIEGSKKSDDLIVIPESKTFDTFESSHRLYSTKSIPNKDNFFLSPVLALSCLDDRGWSALHMAAHCDRIDIVNILLAFGADVDALSLENETPLHLACQRGHQAIIFKLLDSGANVNTKNCSGQVPLHVATEYGHSTCVSTLIYFGTLQANLDLNCLTNSGNTSLHIAAMWGFESIVKCLLDNGASTLLKNNKGFRASEIASTRKLGRLINVKSRQEELDIIEKSKVTDVPDIIRPNLSQSINKKVPKKTTKYFTLKNKVIDNFQSQIYKDSQNSVTTVTVSDNLTKKIEKLLKVVADGDIEMLKFLLDITDEDSLTSQPIDLRRRLCHPLCQCRECHPFQKIMIKSNNNQLHINSTNKEGFHSLHIAAIHDRSTIAKFLLHHGADPNVKTLKLELTPLHLAAIYGSIKVTSILLSKEVDPNTIDKKKNSALFYACMKEKYECAELIIQSGGLVNMVNIRGNTPLHEAVRTNNIDIIKLLLEHGASLNISNSKGILPIDIVKDLNTYLYLKKIGETNFKKEHIYEGDGAESGMESISSSFYRDKQNMENDNVSMSSDISVELYTDPNSNENDRKPLFPDDLKFDLSSIVRSESCNSTVTEIDENLLERVDKNSKFNYMLTFKDPNSPSISSANSSK